MLVNFANYSKSQKEIGIRALMQVNNLFNTSCEVGEIFVCEPHGDAQLVGADVSLDGQKPVLFQIKWNMKTCQAQIECYFKQKDC